MKHEDYIYTAADDSFIGIYPQPDFSRIVLGRNGGEQNVSLAMKDAPEFALAILLAAGIDMDHESVGLSMAVRHLRDFASLNEAREKTAALTKRRDELAKELNGGGIDAAHDTWAGQPLPLRDAIDRIIELESAS